MVGFLIRFDGFIFCLYLLNLGGVVVVGVWGFVFKYL